MTIRHIQRWVIAFLPHLSQFHKSWIPPNRLKLSCGSLSKSFSLSAFHTPGLIRRNHPLLIGLRERWPNRRSVLRGLDWLRLIHQLRQWLQMAPFVALEKGRENSEHIYTHTLFISLFRRACVRGRTWPFMNANTVRSRGQMNFIFITFADLLCQTCMRHIMLKLICSVPNASFRSDASRPYTV